MTTRAMTTRAWWLAPAVCVAALVAAWAVADDAPQDDPLQAWAVAPGYALERVADGFELTTSIAAVPEPGADAGDPRLFVAGLRGAITALRMDGSTDVVATARTTGDQNPDLVGNAQQGLGGICLDPPRGYLFATYAAPDASGVLRNHIARFALEPGTFAGPAGEPVELATDIGTVQAAASHQIGNCIVLGDRVFAGVGDGGNASKAGDPAVPLGKVLCVGVEGGPCDGAPFAGSDGAQRFVWAMGFRNPFGIAASPDGLFVVQNGIDIDALMHVQPGRDYLWSGMDQGIAAAAARVFYPVLAPVAMTYLAADDPVVAEGDRGLFAVGVFGDQGTNAGIVLTDAGAGDPPQVQRYLLEHVGSDMTGLGAVARAPDGIYTAPMMPLPDGTQPLLRVRFDPEHAHAVTVQPRGGLLAVGRRSALDRFGCTGCHAINGRGGAIGPALDNIALKNRLSPRLNRAGYADQVAAVDARTDDPFPALRSQRHEVLAAHGNRRVWVWLRYYLQNPRFDNPDVAMPNLGLTDAQAVEARAALASAIGLGRPRTPLEQLGHALWIRRKPLALGAAAGLLLGLVVGVGAGWWAARRRRARASG